MGDYGEKRSAAVQVSSPNSEIRIPNRQKVILKRGRCRARMVNTPFPSPLPSPLGRGRNFLALSRLSRVCPVRRLTPSQARRRELDIPGSRACWLRGYPGSARSLDPIQQLAQVAGWYLWRSTVLAPKCIFMRPNISAEILVVFDCVWIPRANAAQGDKRH